MDTIYTTTLPHPAEAALDHYYHKGNPYVTAEAKNKYTSLESKSSYIHLVLWTLLAIMIISILTSTFM